MNKSKWEELYRQVGIPAPPKIKLYKIPRLTGSNAAVKSSTNPIIAKAKALLAKEHERHGEPHETTAEVPSIVVHEPEEEEFITQTSEVNDDLDENLATILMTHPDVERRKGAFPGTTRRPFSAKFPVTPKNVPVRPMVAYKNGQNLTRNNPVRPKSAYVSRRPATAKNSPSRSIVVHKNSPISKSCMTLNLDFSKDPPPKARPKSAALSSASSSCLKAIALSRKYDEATLRDCYTSPALSFARSASCENLAKTKVHRQFSNSTTLHCDFPMLEQEFVLKGQTWNDCHNLNGHHTDDDDDVFEVSLFALFIEVSFAHIVLY